MTLLEVLDRVDKIRQIANDDYEIAHGEEDKLHIDVLRAIVEMGKRSDAHPDLDMAKLAEAALLTTEISFPRYCA